METSVRNKKLSLKEELLCNPRQFSFEIAAYVLEFGSQTSFGKEANLADAPFQTKSVNSFHLRGTEIEKIVVEDNRPVIYTERLSISGLNAPLPTPYAELIFRRDREQDAAIGNFINSFNARLLGISYQISRRRYLSLQRHDKACLLLKTIAAFSGESFEMADRRTSRLSYLFWTKEKSAAGLESVIHSFLQFTVKVIEIKPFWIDRKGIQPLGQVTLSGNAELGKKLSMSSFGVEINLTHDDYNRIFQLLVNEKFLRDLKHIIRKYLGDFFHCALSLTPKSVPPLEIGKALLGKTAWIPGKRLDSAKTIC
ncbi:MAG: type VI secretion system baseplate subunit TssG [Holosporaceae bacterium]|jgi:predicted component of type VI protein secretion system|nr:type VI secretion system baseplate subunit TssG [Holosporaceae bacterium]